MVCEKTTLLFDNPQNSNLLVDLLGVKSTPKKPICTFLSSYLRNEEIGNVKKPHGTNILMLGFENSSKYEKVFLLKTNFHTSP